MDKFGTFTAVFDIVLESDKGFATEYGAISYTNIDELLTLEKEVNVVFICTAIGLHAAHTIKAFKRNFHIL